ncbi:MAG: class I mannose-6-phosphate isomerase, partial [Actinomycetota bacterium]
MKPVMLGPNQFRRFFRGGPAIAELRGIDPHDDHSPEDWIGSITTTFGSERDGATRLDRVTLKEAIEQDPEAFLGPRHVESFGADPALLVKLLDAGERLPVHFHPDRSFARRYLRSRYGKTEAWFIVAARAGAEVGLGFDRDVPADRVAAWVSEQDGGSMLAALNRIAVAPGDTLFVPAGTPHTIGEGILIVELQEPTDLSVLLEWKSFDIDGAEEGHLGLGFETALRALDRSALSSAGLEALSSTRPGPGRPGVEVLFPPEADGFFRAERIRAPALDEWAAGFAILVVIDGSGTLESS